MGWDLWLARRADSDEHQYRNLVRWADSSLWNLKCWRANWWLAGIEFVSSIGDDDLVGLMKDVPSPFDGDGVPGSQAWNAHKDVVNRQQINADFPLLGGQDLHKGLARHGLLGLLQFMSFPRFHDWCFDDAMGQGSLEGHYTPEEAQSIVTAYDRIEPLMQVLACVAKQNPNEAARRHGLMDLFRQAAEEHVALYYGS